MKGFRMAWWSLLLAVPLAVGIALGATATAQETIVFGDFNFDSAQVTNRVTGFIVKNGYGYPVRYQFGASVPIYAAIKRGEIDVTMELWRATFQDYARAAKAGEIVSLGPNYADAPQAWYVPTYMIEGDPERGIEPMTPDLHSVFDLPKYWKVFQDPENPNKGRFYNCPASWVCYSINRSKLEAYGLDEYYAPFPGGSEAALNASLISAYKQGEPWLGYGYEPTWIMGELDMTRLEEPAYTEECWADWENWKEGEGCAYPPSPVLVAVSGKFYENGPPEVIEFFGNVQTPLDVAERALAYQHNNNTTPGETALWFLRKYEDMWTQWVPASVAQKVKAALDGAGA